MLNQINIAKRIALGFAILLLFILLICLAALYNQQRLQAVSSDMMHHTLRYSLALDDARYQVGNLRRYEKDMFLNIAKSEKVSEYKKKWDETLEKAGKALKQATEAARPEQQADVQKLEASLAAYAQGLNAVHQEITAGQVTTPADANAAMDKHKAAVRKLGDDITALTDASLEAAMKIDDQLDAISDSNRSKLITLGAIALVLAVAAAFYITNSIRRPLAQMQDMIRSIDESKQINLRLPILGNDEVSATSASMNNLLAGMGKVIGAAKQNSTQLFTASQELANAASQVSSASGMQAEAASSTAAAVEELAVSVNMISDNSRSLEADARNVAGTAAASSSRARAAADEILQIAEAIGHSTTLIGKLNQRSDEIGSIAMVIKEIADQTNLLALNAAIEAARAGELGRGFAVVADEVRKLAERTTQATVEITSKIQAVQQDTAEASRGMQQASGRVDQGVETTQEVSSALGEIEAMANSTVAHVSSIAIALKEQSQASQEIARHVERISQASEENNMAARSTNELSQRLTGLASQLDGIIQQYRT
ncbi:methyl-accepting chemotaxis protein [Chitinilyticum piscinae]|uniref:Methyl-accepting chemotaxis protein n=1 Tax=Chitinilyticum piscinae TaxID=2866724 RepID=A0A8J7FP23_9NEIS|nr:methyl-accepting chemotaxis protein [Chitinilyticum piscinae]MBE9609614.1 methyl-accepting chemotaxis protein [Chitinilyticum piscinae]